MAHARKPSLVHKLLLGTAGTLWLVGVVGAFGAILLHSGAAGAAASAPRNWPAAAPIARAADVPTLLVFCHPQCPCTPPTLEELNRLLARCAAPVHVEVLFYSDPALGADWVRTESWRDAEAIAGVVVREDPLGAAARVFGAHTSGQVLLYDASGALRFSGGITPSRGHAGDSLGQDALQTLLAGGVSADRAGDEQGASGAARGPGDVCTADVYGCSLFAPERNAP